MDKLVVIRGAGELASAIAHRLHRSGYRVLMAEQPNPTAVRRNIVFSEAIYDGEKTVERLTCYRADDMSQAEKLLKEGQLVIMIDPKCECLERFKPAVLIDAIYAKRNIGTTKDMAPLTIAIGPGFAAGTDVDYVIETSRGHNLGRIIKEGYATPEQINSSNSSVVKASHAIIAPCEGHIKGGHPTAYLVSAGETIAILSIDDEHDFPIKTPIDGVLRGLIHDGTPVRAGLKIAEIDPSTRPDNCYSISAKSRCVSGSVLEIILNWETNQPKKKSRLGFFKKGK